MEYCADLMSYRINIVFPESFYGTILNRISGFRAEKHEEDYYRHRHRHRIVHIEIEALENKLPINSITPIARLEEGSLFFDRYDMSGKFSGNILKIKLLNNIFSFDTAMRVLFSHMLMQSGGFLIHSSSISVRGLGILFVGVSGSGKTTIARLSNKHNILSDEISAVAKVEDEYFLYGNTFFNDLNDIGPNERAKLKQVYILHKALYNDIGTADKSISFSNIIRNIMCFTKDQESSEKVMENVMNLTGVIPVNNLHFLPEISVYDTINSHLSGEKKFIIRSKKEG